MLETIVVTVLAIIFSLILLVLTETEHGVAAFFIMLAASIAVLFKYHVGTSAIWSWVVGHPIVLLSYVGIYFIIGVAWSMIKLYEKVHNDSKRYGSSVAPQALEYSCDITRWISYWPLSLVWTFLSNPLTKISKWLFTNFTDLYQKVINSAFAHAKK